MELRSKMLAMEKSMGKENFKKWVESTQIKIPTRFKTKTDLVKNIKKAGYDARNWGSSIKTHINGEKDFFFWEFENGKWNAVFSKHDSKSMINAFIKDFEAKTGIKSFNVSPDEVKTHKVLVHKSLTNFKDENLLIKTLSEYGANPVKNHDGNIVVNIDGGNFKFYKVEEEPYHVEIRTRGDSNRILNHLSLIDEDYKNNVQAYTYEKLRQNLYDRNLNIENEEVLNDNSILITVNIENK